MAKKKKEKNSKKDNRSSIKREHSSSSISSNASTTASEAATFPSRTQQREKEKVKAIAREKGIEHLVHTQHHHIPKASKEGAAIKGHRAAVFYGPKPDKRTDDPGSKGNDIQYELFKGQVRPTRDAQKSIDASKNHNHATKQELKKASKARRPEKLVTNAANGWEHSKKTDTYKKKTVSPFAAFTACFSGSSSGSSSKSKSSQKSGKSQSNKNKGLRR